MITLLKQRIIKVCIVDDLTLHRWLISNVLLRDPGIEILFEATNGKECINKLYSGTNYPDICILDIAMPIMNGYDTAIAIRNDWPKIKILVFSFFAHKITLLQMINLGVTGFMSKHDDPMIILNAVHEMMQNNCFYSPALPKEIFNEEEVKKAKCLFFTKSEKKIFYLLCKELTCHQISNELNLSLGTILTHKRNIYKKAEVNTREGLVMFGILSELLLHYRY